MNRQQILSRLAARGWPIVYSTGPLTLWDRGGGEWAAAPLLSRTMRREGLTVDLPGRLPPLHGGGGVLDRMLVRAAAWRLRRLAGPRDRLILYLFHPKFAAWMEPLRPDRILYHAYDQFTAGERGAMLWSAKEAAVLRRADLCVASSDAIAEGLRAKVARPVEVLPNGVEFDRFAGAAEAGEPADLAAVPRPRVGYVGYVNPKVDLPLVDAVAERLPDMHWVFVGEVQESEIARAGMGAALERCRARHNVHFLGHRDYRDLPAYMHAMDVNVMCYRSTDDGWWYAVSPLKLHEYLAVGRPVVSADLPAIRPFGAVIDIRAGAEGWVEGLRRAVETGGVSDPGSRRAVARENDWDARVDRLEGWLRDLAG